MSLVDLAASEALFEEGPDGFVVFGAEGEDHYNAMRAGVRSLYMNRRPNLQQMTALIELLETILSYVAEDNALFQRLKTDLARDKADDTAPASAPEIGAPATAQPDMRQLKV